MSIYLGKKIIINSNAKEIYKGNTLVYPIQEGYPNDGNVYFDVEEIVYRSSASTVASATTYITNPNKNNNLGCFTYTIDSAEANYHDQYAWHYWFIKLKAPMDFNILNRQYINFSVMPNYIQMVKPTTKQLKFNDLEVTFAIYPTRMGLTWENVKSGKPISAQGYNISTGARGISIQSTPQNSMYACSTWIGSSWQDESTEDLKNIEIISFAIHSPDKLFNSTRQTAQLSYTIGSFCGAPSSYTGTFGAGGVAGTIDG